MEKTMQKSLLDDADFSNISFHDNLIHAMTFGPDESAFLIDIDYLAEWISPDKDGYYSFVIAPSTLVFKDIYDLQIDVVVKSVHTFDIYEINREEQPPKKGVNVTIYNYEIVLGHVGKISFSSTGFNMYPGFNS